ncbi:kinesin motor protein cin8 [Pichia californica]|uniref:Kinesin-like protein n=1 Tax=Pichia californica TaxID=460514 RepID=A0A9P7BH35_9ASCO|nr:kinesin motor protein cin8 [[Candida] californica]
MSIQQQQQQQQQQQSRLNSSKRPNSQDDAYTENINVIVRCRGRGHIEHEQTSPTIAYSKDEINQIHLTLPEETNLNLNENLNSRVYTLDKVFGPSTDQMTFFQNTADKTCDEFLKGFNCTIFAYGQTGAGKTYTMCGNIKDKTLTPESGIIPRCLHKLFDNDNDNNNSNNSNSNKDTYFKCSFVEIYNEVLRDLLSDGSNDNKLKIYEQNKNIKIQSLEEFYIKNFDEAMKMLYIGMNKKMVASTKMNENSSRSHTIFTINLIKKLPNGTEYQFAKLNLVDLAGSENIIRSGSINKRAKEAGSINQSLLTLGRVINSLVEGSSFIPYRESKLTRLLQDSLGGGTKTLLIANIAPTLIDLQSTLSTLEYASKAKDIKNSAQIGTLLPEDLLVNELIESNRILKLNLMATRRRENCVILDDNVYKDMQLTISTLNDEVEELRGLKKSLLNQLDNHMKKSEQHKKEKLTLNETIIILEKKLVNFENSFKIHKQFKEEIKFKCQNLYNNFNDNLKYIEESQFNTKTVLSNDILKSLNDVSFNLSSINSDNSITDNTVKQINNDINNISNKLNDIINNKKNSENNLKQSINNSNNIIKDIRENNELFNKSIDNIFEIINKQKICNNEFSLSINEVLQNEDIEFMKKIENEASEKINKFKEEAFLELNKIIKENINLNYFNFLEHYKMKLLNSEKNWNKSNESILNETTKQKLLIKDDIIKRNDNLCDIVGTIGKDLNNTMNDMVNIDNEINELNSSTNNINNNIIILENKNNKKSNLMNNMILDINGNIKKINNVVDEINIVGNNIEDKKDKTRVSVGKILEIENIESISRNANPNKLISLNSNINLNPSISPSKIPRSPIRSPIRSPLRKREINMEDFGDSKRIHR